MHEAQDAASPKEFVQKLLISLREARESAYWLRLMKKSGVVNEPQVEELEADLSEITALLVSIIKKTRQRTV